MSQLAYKLDISYNGRIYFVFLIMQLKPTSLLAEDNFSYLRLENLSFVFIDNDIDSLKFFEIDCLLNKCTVKKGKGQVIKYLLH